MPTRKTSVKAQIRYTLENAAAELIAANDCWFRDALIRASDTVPTMGKDEQDRLVRQVRADLRDHDVTFLDRFSTTLLTFGSSIGEKSPSFQQQCTLLKQLARAGNTYVQQVLTSFTRSSNGNFMAVLTCISICASLAATQIQLGYYFG